MHRRLAFIIIGLLLAAPVVASAGPRPAAAPGAQSGSWNASDCKTCHEKAAGPSFEHTKHYALAQSCATCHEHVAEHFASQTAGSKGPIPTLKNKTPQQINETCLSCHEKANQASYLSGMHARRNVACTSCHSIHSFVSDRSQLKTRTESEACFACHKSERAKTLRTSHHPVREGKMSCASCHNPHEGVRPKMMKADSVNEVCYTCHAEKRGPFLFEHAPVREDCITCHEPHGSNHNRMLAQKAPNLCWNCHLTGSGHFGSGDLYSTEKGVPVAPAGAPSGYPTVNSRFIERACRTCHVKIHGTNHPSGAYFVR